MGIIRHIYRITRHVDVGQTTIQRHPFSAEQYLQHVLWLYTYTGIWDKC